MKYIYIDLLHSYQYINDIDNIKFNNNSNYINDSNNNNLLGMCNIPNDISLYKIFYKYQNNSFKNIKIMVRINFKNLFKIISKGDKIPNSKDFFKLIRRNIYNKQEVEKFINYDSLFRFNSIFKSKSNNLNKWIYKIENKNNFITLLSNNIIKVHNLYIDTKKEKFYLNDTKSILKNNFFIKGGIIYANPITLNRQTFYNNLSKNNKNINNTIIKNNTTLILCDTFKINEWKEILNKKSLIIINSKNSIDKYTYNDLINSQYVLINFNILGNSSYLKKWNILDNNYEDYLKKSKKNIKNINNLSNNIIYQIINWKRIIFDNYYFENKIKEHLIYKHINLFTSEYKWIYKDLKFINYESLIIDLKILLDNKYDYIDCNKLKTLSNHIKIITSSNTYYKINNIGLNFSDFEKEYYLYLKDNKFDLKQFCSLSDNIYKNNFEILDEINETNRCPICLDNITKENSAKLPCNHHFCFTCIFNWKVNQNSNCPICRQNFNKITKIVEKQNICNIDLKTIINNKLYGTKIKYIIEKIYNNIINKKYLLILSQHDETINYIESFLINMNINYNILSKKKNLEESFISLINIKNIPNIRKIDKHDYFLFIEPLYNDKNYLLNTLYSKLLVIKKSINFDILFMKNSIEELLYLQYDNNRNNI